MEERFMDLAINEARKAEIKDEVPPFPEEEV